MPPPFFVTRLATVRGLRRLLRVDSPGGGGSANKSFLFHETKALLNPEGLTRFLDEKLRSLGTSACPPYHLALVVGGLSAEPECAADPPRPHALTARPCLPPPTSHRHLLMHEHGLRATCFVVARSDSGSAPLRELAPPIWPRPTIPSC